MADSATETVDTSNAAAVASAAPKTEPEKSFYLKVLAAERALNISQADGIYDPVTAKAVEDFVVSAFSQYYTEQKSAWEAQHPGQSFALRVTGAGTPQTFEFDEAGDIYTLKQNGSQLVRGDKVSNIRAGIQRSLNQSINPHEAAHALISTISLQRQNELRNNGLDEKQKATETFNQTLQTTLRSWGQSALEAPLRKDIKASNGSKETLAQSASVQQLKDSGVDVSALDDFLTILLQQQALRSGISADAGTRSQDTARYESVGDLLHFMATGQGLDPMLQARNNAGYGLRDNILGLNAYNVLNRMYEGEYIAVDALYDQNNPQQFESIQAYFSDKAVQKNGVWSVTREQVFEYVKQEFEKRAIEKLGSLDKVSQAMYNGEFNPYEKDMHIVFKALPAPSLNDPTWRKNVDDLRRAGTFPTAAFTQQVLGDSGIHELIKADPSAFSSLRGNTAEEKIDAWRHTRMNDRITILDKINKAPSAALLQNEHFIRQTHAFYEEYSGNYTWWRNGENGTNDPNTWNGRYGGLNQTQEMHMFMRYNAGKLDTMFGKDVADQVFRNSEGRISYDAQYDSVVSALNAKDPSGQLVAKLTQGMEDVTRPSMYSYLLDNRIDHYRQLRTNVYMPAVAPPPQPAQNGATQNNTGTNPASGAQGTNPQNGGSAANGNADGAQSSASGVDPTLDPTIPGNEETDITMPSDGNPEGHTLPLKNIPLGIKAAQTLKSRFTRNSAIGSEVSVITSNTPKVQVLEGHVIDPKAKRLGFQPEIIDAEFTEVKTLPDKSAKPRALPAPEGKSLTVSGREIFNEAGSKYEPIPRNRSLVIVSETKDLAHLKKVASGGLLKVEAEVGETALKLGGKFARIAGKGAKYIPLLGAAIGGGMAYHETSKLEERLNTLKSMGLLTNDQARSVKQCYTAFIGQAAIDPTLIGGEIAINARFAALGLNPAVRAMIEPDFLFDGLGTPDVNHKDIVKLYDKLAKDHGLPEKIKVDLGSHGTVEMSIGSAMCDPKLAAHIRDVYAENARALQGLDKIGRLNNVAKEWVDVQNEPSLFVQNAASIGEPATPKSVLGDAFKPIGR